MNVGRQVVSFRIDEKLETILRTQVAAIADKVDHGAASRYEPEIELLVSLLYQYFTFTSGQSPGMRAMQLKFSGLGVEHQRCKYYWYTLLVLRWLYQRTLKVSNVQGWRNLPEGDKRRDIAEVLLKINRLVKFIQIVNKLYFLLYGKFPSIFHRISSHELESAELNEHSNSFIQQAQVFLKDKQVLSDIILGVFSSLTHVVAWKDLVDMALGTVIMNRRTED